jgi:UDP-N-acetylglucosamine transferase subunit ALG13
MEATEAMETVERNISETTITIRSHLPKTEFSSRIQEAFRMVVAAGEGSLINLLRLTNPTIEVINNRAIPEAFRMVVAAS